MNNAFLKSFQTLKAVYDEKAFSSVTLNKTLLFCTSQDRALITKIVYGVLDNDIKLNYAIGKFVKKMPKGDTLVYLKIGAFCLMELSIPVYAVVNDVAELSKLSADKRIVGFVNATLKSMAASDIKNFDDYPADFVVGTSIRYSYPEWAFRKLIKDYGKETAEKIVSHKADNRTTARFVGNVTAEQIQVEYGCNAVQTALPNVFYLSSKMPKPNEKFTPQSISSVAVAKIVANCGGNNVLDCCSAPGGKAVCIKQLCPQAAVTACDVHPHRVELINSYAARMGVEIKTVCADMTLPMDDFVGKFDTVLCDVPCSGFGVLDSRPDIKLFRHNEDISSLMKLQYAILSNCSNYVASGGSLVYSTCTIFDNENGQNVRKFLKEHTDFSYGTIHLPKLPQTDGKPFYQFLPCVDNMSGFYVAVLKRN